jgi:hypothetical protein
MGGSPPRNGPCTCGSGRKYKKCHGGPGIAINAGVPPQLAQRVDESNGITFTTTDGKVMDPRVAIMPLILQHTITGKLSALGTCFPVFSHQNIFLTARHVVEHPAISCTGDINGTFSVSDGYRLVSLWMQNPNESKVKYDFRGVLNLWKHPTADLALGHLQGLIHKVTKERWDDRVPGWDFRIPQVGERICTYAYPDIRGETNIDVVRQAHSTTTARTGVIEETFPSGGGPSRLHAPCFQTDMDLRSGMSGGPVFNTNGRLCGVNSTGYDFQVGLRPLSFISMLHPILDVQLPGERPEGVSFRELVGLRQLDAVNVPGLAGL